MSVENDNTIMKQILKEPQMLKFRLYGFFKNLKFFEPYLLVILLHWGYNLTQIGLFVMVQQIVTYFVEVPSGIFADKYGKKRELLICFILYIISFGFFFFGDFHWVIILVASIFFGLAEAFRSGTHKSMILLWLDKKGYREYKTFVYGRTRSWSLLGSAISGVSSIFLVIFAPASKYVFLFTIVPYIADFILIATYPSYMNEKLATEKRFTKEIIKGFKEIFIALKSVNMRKGLFSISLYNGIFKVLKDYIQPIVKLFIVLMLANIGLQQLHLDTENAKKIMLGVLYSIFYLVSSFASRYAYIFKNLVRGAKRSMDILFYIFGALLALNALFIYLNVPILVVVSYLFIYVFHAMRKPFGVDYLGGIMKKEERATMLSVESQLTSIFQLSFAPIFGYIADTLNFVWLFVIVGGVMLLLNALLLTGNNESEFSANE